MAAALLERRNAMLHLGSVLLAACVPAFAQQPAKVPRIGIFFLGVSSSLPSGLRAFHEGLRQLGYVEGKNVVLEIRNAADSGRLFDAASELARLQVAVIVAGGTPANRAARKATSTIPIVMPLMADPVREGLVRTLARPGGNITGLSFLAPELNAKRVQLLKEAFPKMSRLAVLSDSKTGSAASASELETIKTAGRALGIELAIHDVTNALEIDGAFKAAQFDKAAAMLTVPSPLFQVHRLRLLELASATRLPVMYHYRDYAEEGGLMSYGPSYRELYRSAAVYVDKILKGAKPGELPIEQPTKFELVLNRKAAKAIGIAFPQSILLRADQVIE